MPTTALPTPTGEKRAVPPTPADDPILAALNAYHFLTSGQVQRLLYGKRSTKYAPLRLANLVAGKYVLVDYPAPPRTAGRAKGVYMLDAKGRRYVSGVLGLEAPRRFRPSELTERSYSFYSHTLSVNDVLIAAELLAQRRPDIRLTEVRHELALKHVPIAVTVRATDEKTGKESFQKDALLPDGFLDVVAGNRRFPICLEVDKGTQGQKEWRAKIRRYLGAFERALEQHFNAKRVSVAVFALPHETPAI